MKKKDKKQMLPCECPTGPRNPAVSLLFLSSFPSNEDFSPFGVTCAQFAHSLQRNFAGFRTVFLLTPSFLTPLRYASRKPFGMTVCWERSLFPGLGIVPLRVQKKLPYALSSGTD
jgi:hypothetical protein